MLVTMTTVTKRLPPLPVERALKMISGRWKPLILYYLFVAPRRHSELGRLIPGITQKVLVGQLRDLQEHGLVTRRVHEGGAPHVEYAPTELGLQLEPILVALCRWGRDHAEARGELDRTADCIVRPLRPPEAAAR